VAAGIEHGIEAFAHVNGRVPTAELYLYGEDRRERVSELRRLVRNLGFDQSGTRIMEFMSQGIPAVVSRTKLDSFYFNEGVVHFFNSGDSRAIDTMLDVVNKKELRETLVKRGS